MPFKSALSALLLFLSHLIPYLNTHFICMILQLDYEQIPMIFNKIIHLLN